MRISSGGSEFVNVLESDAVTLRGNDKQTNDGFTYIIRTFLGSSSSNYSYFQCKNPASSGKTVLVDKVTLSSSGSAGFLLRLSDTDLTTDLANAISLKPGNSDGVTQGRVQHSTNANLGTSSNIYADKASSTTVVTVNFEYPVILDEGKAIVARCRTINTDGDAIWYVREY